MNGAMDDFLLLDLMPLCAALLAALSCGLLGNFLVLRRQSLLGDAISHSVLPGIVVAFLLTGTRSPVVMLLGAAGAGLLSVLLTEVVKRLGRVEAGAAMGVVFSLFFAAGIYLMQRAARNVDLDADCVLYGQLETLFWSPPAGVESLLSPGGLASIPRQVTTLAIVTAVSIAFIAAMFKELRLMSFDPELAKSLGFRPGWLGALLLALVAAATVAAFEAVGSILVIAMLICPAATARMLTDRLRTQIILSGAIAVATAGAGYLGATRLAPALGLPGALNAAGAIAVGAGAAFAIAAIASPSHGVVAGAVRRLALSRRIAMEDLLATLYRVGEGSVPERAVPERLARTVPIARRRGLIEVQRTGPKLTPKGDAAARAIVRRHRLWETYLVERAGMLPDHVHAPAETLEHVLNVESAALDLDPLPEVDPQGKRIPEGG